MIANLSEYLRGRQIAPILERSHEKKDEIALQVMTIIDYELESHQFYTRIKQSGSQCEQRRDYVFIVKVELPNLFDQLLSIHSFKRFHYFKYKPAMKEFDFILQCTHCPLIGPYYLILSHMALAHDTHVGSKLCQWCKKSNMNDHIVLKTVEVCYKKYLENENISDTNPSKVIIDFYELIEDLAKKLGVCTDRNTNYVGKKMQKGYFRVMSQPFKHMDRFKKLFANTYPGGDLPTMQNNASGRPGSSSKRVTMHVGAIIDIAGQIITDLNNN